MPLDSHDEMLCFELGGFWGEFLICLPVRQADVFFSVGESKIHLQFV